MLASLAPKFPSMKFSLRSLLIFSIIASALLGSAVLSRQQAIQVEKRSRDFVQLHRESQRFETEVVNAVIDQKEVVDSFQVISQVEPNTIIQDLLLGAESGSGGMHNSSGYFWESAEGSFKTSYTYQLRRPKEPSISFVDVTLSASFDSQDDTTTVLQFSFPKTDPNQAVVEMLITELSKRFDFETEIRHLPNRIP